MSITDSDAEAIRVYHCLMGRSLTQTARDFGCHPNMVDNICHGKTHNGRKRGNPGKSKLSEKQDEIILAMIRKNPKHTAKSIAAKLGWKKHCVSDRLNQMSKAGIIENVRQWVMVEK